jgi:hypothetical protein
LHKLMKEINPLLDEKQARSKGTPPRAELNRDVRSF